MLTLLAAPITTYAATSCYASSYSPTISRALAPTVGILGLGALIGGSCS